MVKLTIVLGMVMVLSTSSTAFGTSLPYQTGFETGDDMGTNITGTGAPVIDSTVNYSGVNSAKNGVVARLFDLDILATYKVSFWMKVTGTATPVSITHLRAPELAYSDKPYIDSMQPLPNVTTSDWNLYEHELLGRGTFILFIFGRCNNNDYINNTSWVDDISVSVVRTREQNKTYYGNVLTDVNAGAELKTEANTFFANLYEYVDKTLNLAIPYLKALTEWERAGNCYMDAPDYLNAIEMYKKAASKAALTGTSGEEKKIIADKLESAILTAKQVGLMPK